jgi:hypothetical protein
MDVLDTQYAAPIWFARWAPVSPGSFPAALPNTSHQTHRWLGEIVAALITQHNTRSYFPENRFCGLTL